MSMNVKMRSCTCMSLVQNSSIVNYIYMAIMLILYCNILCGTCMMNKGERNYEMEISVHGESVTY